MGARKADLEKKWFRLWVVFDPPASAVADKHVRMHVFILLPFESAHAFRIVFALAVPFALLFENVVRLKRFVPLVEEIASFEISIGVFDDMTFVEAEWSRERRSVHLADVDAAIAGFAEVFDPRVLPGVGVAHNSRGVWVEAGEDGGARGSAGWRGNVALFEADAFLYQPI